jgi:hypothetical protein
MSDGKQALLNDGLALPLQIILRLILGLISLLLRWSAPPDPL